MARARGKTAGNDHPKKRNIERYEHTGKKRTNNPPVGLVTPETDPPLPTHKVYDYIEPVPTVKPGKELDYDAHLDPQLVWAGKKEHASFEVPTVSLHVHETIDPRTIVEAVRKRNGNGRPAQPSLFERPEEKLSLHDAIDFYKHAHGWSNRLIAGDSLLVMNSLLEKEGMAGQVQMVYIDPPYGIKYGSNFQPFVNKRDVKDGKDEDLTQEPEMIRAFRDTWELNLHSYLTYLRDRLLLARELMHESGSVFVQISDENVHFVRAVMDEVYGSQNFVSQITFRKKLMPLGAKTLEMMADYLVWYAKDKSLLKYRQLYRATAPDPKGRWTGVRMPDGTLRRLTSEERKDFAKITADCDIFGTVSQWAPSFSEANVYPFAFESKVYEPTPGQCWVTSSDKMERLARIGRLFVEGDYPRYVIFHSDFPFAKITNPWDDTAPAQDKIFVVQTNPEVVQRCVLMTTDPGDIVLDPTCGSGTAACVAEQWGRRWITCDTSRVAITLAKQRLMTGVFDYYTQIVYSPAGGKLAYYRHADWLGGSRFASTPSRGLYYDVAYAPYGEKYSDTGTQDLNFTGQNQDTASYLYDFLYREYHPTSSRWIQPDPAGLGAVSMATPQTWNRYAYVGNNPLAAIDPLGLCGVADIGDARRGGTPDLSPGGLSDCFMRSVFGDNYYRFAGKASPIREGLTSYLSSIPWYNVRSGKLYSHFGFYTPNPGYDPTDPSSLLGTSTSVDVDLGPISTGSDNGSFWSYLASKPWVLSWIFPLAPDLGMMGVGPAGNVAWEPQTHSLCAGIGAGASVGKNVSLGPLLFGKSFTGTPYPNNAIDILRGWSVSGGANLPWPSPMAGLGYQAVGNSSGIAHGPTVGVFGISGSVTYSWCAQLF